MKFYVSQQNLSEVKERIDNRKSSEKYFVEVKKLGTYSQQQQGYYRGVCIKSIAEECGYTGTQGFYLGGLEVIMNGEEYLHAIIKGLNRRITSTNCNKDEYAELIQTAITIAEFLGIEIPPPES